MNELIRILRYEIKASLRQLSSAVHLNTLECLLLVAFGILLSAALGYVRLATASGNVLMLVISALSLFIGLISFNKRNMQELISGEKKQALRTLPTEYRIIQFAKIEKLLFASCTIYAAVCVYILTAFLLSGSSISIVLHIVLAILAFIAGQNLRAFVLVIGKNIKSLKYISVIAAICSTVAIYRYEVNWHALLDASCAFYTANTVPILFTVLLFTILLKSAMLLIHGKTYDIHEKKDMRNISNYLAHFISRFNSVTLRDMRGILHSAKNRRRFMSGLITLPVMTWILAIVMRMKLIPIDISISCTMCILALLIGTSYSGLFENQMTIGYEGNMILAYVLSGSSVSIIQQKRLKGSLMISVPMTLVSTLITALLLGADITDTLTGTAISAAGCISLSCINAYYFIKGTSYFNELNRPRMISSIIRIVFKTLLDMLVMIPVTLAEFLPMSNVLHIILWCYVPICAATTLIFYTKLMKGDKYFYGEYQSIAV